VRDSRQWSPNLSNEMLVSMAGCAAMASANYEPQFVELVNNEVSLNYFYTVAAVLTV